jgi:hypothetical protein
MHEWSKLTQQAFSFSGIGILLIWFFFYGIALFIVGGEFLILKMITLRSFHKVFKSQNDLLIIH